MVALEQAQDFVTSLLPNVRNCFEQDGFLHPVSFIGAQVNPETGEPFELGGKIAVIVITPEVLGVSIKDSQGTQAYTMGLRTIAKKCKAIMNRSENGKLKDESADFTPIQFYPYFLVNHRGKHARSSIRFI